MLYVVAGQLVEAVSGQSWEDFTEQRLFKPLGMKDSSTQVDRVLASKNRTRLHGRFDGPMRGMGTLEVFKDSKEHLINQTAGPAGSIYASAADMAPWLKLMLANGELGEGKRLLSAANAAELFKPQTIEPGDRLPAVLDGRRPNFVLYALGWNVMDYRGHKIIVHSGAVEGGKAVVGLLPEKGIGLSILMNSEDGGARWGLFYQLLDHYLGLPPQDWTGKFKTAVEEMSAKGMEALKQMQVAPQAEAAGGPSLPLAKYVGSYRDAWYGDMKISADATGKKLSVAFLPTPTMQGPLEHVRHDTFRTRFADRSIEDTFLTFALKPDGSIDQIKLQAVSPLADFSFDFHDLLFTPTP